MGLNVPSLPLYQKPTFLVFKSKLQGLADNPTTGGRLWNMRELEHQSASQLTRR